MTPASKTAAIDLATLPGRGRQVMLDDLPGGPWLTTVDGVSEDGVVLLAPPRLGGKTVRLPIGRRARVSYSLGEVPTEMDVEMVAAPDGASPSYTARLVGGPRRLQRRNAVRVPINLIAQATGDDKTISAVTENLSGGGALLRVAQPIKANTDLAIKVECGGAVGTVSLKGRVVRCDRVGAEERPWRVALAFVDPPVTTQEQLVHFLFERQRELRRREAGLD
jgi:hypothetical protein